MSIARGKAALCAAGAHRHVRQALASRVQVPDLPVYGCAIPTVTGLRLVLDALGAAYGAALQLHDCGCACVVLLLSAFLICCTGLPALWGRVCEAARVSHAGERKVLWQNMREEPVLYVSLCRACIRSASLF